jgi:hypothetical protein
MTSLFRATLAARQYEASPRLILVVLVRIHIVLIRQLNEAALVACSRQLTESRSMRDFSSRPSDLENSCDFRWRAYGR